MVFVCGSPHSFTADVAGDYVAELVVNDGTSDSNPGQVAISCFECVNPPAGLAGWWPADGDITDFAGNSPTGNLRGNAGFGPGHVDQAFVFDGIDSWVDLGDGTGLDNGTGPEGQSGRGDSRRAGGFAARERLVHGRADDH